MLAYSGPQEPRDVSELQARSYIEVQFPVSRLSKESYRERKAVAGQTLTGLGKWWGRKPLVLVRAIILGLLLPVSEDPIRDRDTFLALMTMDDDGLLGRLDGAISARDVYAHCTDGERAEYFEAVSPPKWKSTVTSADLTRIQRRAFLRMGYDVRLQHCKRPEQVAGPSYEAWRRINEHLGTHAATLTELVDELGERRFGHRPRLGDAFCGGGSIPFEAARLGCDVYAADLSPVASLLTWGALNLTGGTAARVQSVRLAQRSVFDAVRHQVDEWGIESNERGWVADAYLYCHEVIDPSTGWRVPLAPSWIIAPKPRVCARLVPDPKRRRFGIEIVEGASVEELATAGADGTWDDGVRCPVDRDGNWLPPNRRLSTSMEQLRGFRGLRLWEPYDFVPRPDDTFQERLYCIRWFDPTTGERHYLAPTAEDLERESRVTDLLRERIAEWQAKGYVPSRRVEPGQDNNRPLNARGWTYWHHFFHPRQLLVNGLFAQAAAQQPDFEAKALMLFIGRLANLNSRLCRWKVGQSGGIGGAMEVFFKPSLSTPFANYACRTMDTLESAFCVDLEAHPVPEHHTLRLCDARQTEWSADIWLTDPGYADSVNYEELSEFFLAWYDRRLVQLFPDWYSDSKRALAVSGRGSSFRVALADCYRRLAREMAEDGYQVVMFTHQDPEIWTDLALVLWASGLRVTAAWTIGTETESAGIKHGNFVQGTVVLILRRREGDLRGEMVDLYPDLQAEIRSQLDNMRAVDVGDEPNFDDADYQLAAYAASLRVLTRYSTVGEVDVDRELRRERPKGEKSPVTRLIEQAVKVASDMLVPSGLEKTVWRRLTPPERLYLKGMELEVHGETRDGVYQELARAYGAEGYRSLLASKAANRTRLKTPSELGATDLLQRGADGFGGTLLRHVLFAISKTSSDPELDPHAAREYLHRQLDDYWTERSSILELLRYLATKPTGLHHWRVDVRGAELLRGSIESDSA